MEHGMASIFASKASNQSNPSCQERPTGQEFGNLVQTGSLFANFVVWAGGPRVKDSPMGYHTQDARHEFDSWSRRYDRDPLQNLLFKPSHRLMVQKLMPGVQRVLDVGCGTGRHRALIETRGYSWHGVDRRNMVAATIHADASMLPLPDGSVAAVVAWQILEYVDRPELVFAEASRVLEPGGVFCGSVSFLEPVHGRTYFNLSPHILERLLRRNGFADVEIKPGLNGFALTLWTWLGSTGIPSAESLAIALSLVLLGPLAGIIFFVSWLRWRVGVGSSHTMRWLTQTAPLDFAGHLMFVARKKARA